MIDEDTDEAKLTFGDLKVGDHFIGFPMAGDNSGHGGYLGAHNLFQKTEDKSEGHLVPIQSGAAVDHRGVESHFPFGMIVIKVNTKATLTDKEILALKIMMGELAKYCREDLIGAILYTGAFHALSDGDAAVVALARKLELTDEDKKRLQEAKLL